MPDLSTHIHNWTLVVAMAQNGVIGRDNGLPWRLKADLQRFKNNTMGHCLLMGRKTYESIGRALPGRQTIVLSRQAADCGSSDSTTNFVAPGIAVASSIERVTELVEPGREVMVVGGAQVYRLALHFCNRLLITQVQAEVEGDTRFPQIDWNAWTMTACEQFPADADNDYASEYQVWMRRSEVAT